jgi:hypothetical protein
METFGLLYSGQSFGGVDNMFSNVPASSLVNAEVVGSGGSDHDAISAIIELGSPIAPTLRGSFNAVEPSKAVKDSIGTQCGLLEPSVEYTFHSDVLTHSIDGITDPRRCCTLCKIDENCKAWVMIDWVKSIKGPRCVLKKRLEGKERGNEIIGKVERPGFTSGLPPAEATKLAGKMAAQAISHV